MVLFSRGDFTPNSARQPIHFVRIEGPGVNIGQILRLERGATGLQHENTPALIDVVPKVTVRINVSGISQIIIIPPALMSNVFT